MATLRWGGKSILNLSKVAELMHFLNGVYEE